LKDGAEAAEKLILEIRNGKGLPNSVSIATVLGLLLKG
jgi:hypothetical protein